MKKNKILIFTDYYLPGFKAGGPILSISNIVENLSHEFEFFIVTKDRDITDKNPYSKILVNTWNKVGLANVYYVSGKMSIKRVLFLLKERNYNGLYLNSFFSYTSTILPLLLNKFIRKGKRLSVLLAPRGEFSEGALNLKANKKSLYIQITSFINLYNKIYWQASNIYEKKDILNVLKRVPVENIIISPNVPSINDTNLFYPEFINQLNIVFISRVSPKKNLLFAIKILSNLDINIKFSIYGEADDEKYLLKCKRAIESITKENIKIEYKGAVNNNMVPKLLSQNHLFFLPTHGENYGHAIAESFLAGIPVLISDQTPWRNLAEHQVGWDLSLKDEDEFVSVLTDLYKDLKNGLKVDSNKIRDWFLNEIDFKKTLIKNKDMFNDICK